MVSQIACKNRCFSYFSFYCCHTYLDIECVIKTRQSFFFVSIGVTYILRDLSFISKYFLNISYITSPVRIFISKPCSFELEFKGQLLNLSFSAEIYT